MKSNLYIFLASLLFQTINFVSVTYLEIYDFANTFKFVSSIIIYFVIILATILFIKKFFILSDTKLIIFAAFNILIFITIVRIFYFY